jgi:hypothetical protein
MEFEPKSLEFRDVRLNQPYTNSLCVTNTYPSAVEFTLTPSSPRIAVNPTRVNLSPGQSIVITIRLFLNHNPDLSEGASHHEDSIIVRSSYFEHLINVSYSLHGRETGTSASNSMSPSLRSRTAAMRKSNSRSPSPRVVSKSQKVEDLDSSSSKIKDLERQLSVKGETVQKLENIITQLESRFPSVQEVVRNRLEQERMSFEEKSEKVSHLSTVSSVSTIYPRSNQNSSLTYFSNNH